MGDGGAGRRGERKGIHMVGSSSPTPTHILHHKLLSEVQRNKQRLLGDCKVHQVDGPKLIQVQAEHFRSA